jgi:hypothetical protein
MNKEKLTAYIILEEERWKKPQMGTRKQHISLCKQARALRYTSVRQFLDAWPAYREKRMNIGADGSLDQTQAHWFFLHLRRVRRALAYKMMPND